MKTQRFLLISFSLNLILSGITAYLSFRPAQHPATFFFAAPPMPSPSAVPDETLLAKAPPFQWSQIESADYPTYIANLRAIACPELTIRDIISADIDSLYKQKRYETETMGVQAGWDAQTLTLKLRQLQQEEAQLIVQLMGPSSPTPEIQSALMQTDKSDASPILQEEADGQFADAPLVAIPLALIPPSTDSELSEQQAMEIKNLTQDFIKAIGGKNQNPNDPEYLHRWQLAQPEFDERLKTKFGDEFYNDQQIRAARLKFSPAS